MKFTIAIPIHNKGYMIDKIIDGLVGSIGTDDVMYSFILDGCTDNSRDVLFLEAGAKLKNFKITETNNLFQVKTFNLFMKNFTTDFLILFQDDMVLKDKTFLDNIIDLYSIYKDDLGLVGCRDGFGPAYSGMFGSEFSDSKGRVALKNGEHGEVMMVNIGPIVLTRQLVDKIGYFDELYGIGVYEEMEYSLKCKAAGLTNIVMGVDLIHSKFLEDAGNIEHTSEDIAKQHPVNYAIFHKRWNHIAKI